MKKFLIALPLVGTLCAPTFAQQAPSPANLISLQRSDWGCEVLLCLANPNGPSAVAPCRPPIERLWQELARGHAFPSCNTANGPNGASYAAPGSNPYDACPPGSTELPEGQTAMLAAPMNVAAVPSTYRSGSPSTYGQASTGFAYLGIGDGSSQPSSSNFDNGPPSAKVCVAAMRGSQTMWNGDGNSYDVNLYDTIYIQQAQLLPRFIDVYIDNPVWQRVRW